MILKLLVFYLLFLTENCRGDRGHKSKIILQMGIYTRVTGNIQWVRGINWEGEYEQKY
jgi:hypothetical protein